MPLWTCSSSSYPSTSPEVFTECSRAMITSCPGRAASIRHPRSTAVVGPHIAPCLFVLPLRARAPRHATGVAGGWTRQNTYGPKPESKQRRRGRSTDRPGQKGGETRWGTVTEERPPQVKEGRRPGRKNINKKEIYAGKITDTPGRYVCGYVEVHDTLRVRAGRRLWERDGGPRGWRVARRADAELGGDAEVV